MNTKRGIYKALPIVANAYAKKYGVKIIFSKDDAYTNGQVICLPTIPHDYPGISALWGFLAHEAAHVRFTDFRMFQEVSKLHSILRNIVEDVRIEKEMTKTFPGTILTLNAAAKYYHDANLFMTVSDSDKASSIFLCYCILYAQYKVSNREFIKSQFDVAKTCLSSFFDHKVLSELNALLDSSVNLKSTDESNSLATKIIELIGNYYDLLSNDTDPDSDSESDSKLVSSSGSYNSDENGSGPDRCSNESDNLQDKKTDQGDQTADISKKYRISEILNDDIENAEFDVNKAFLKEISQNVSKSECKNIINIEPANSARDLLTSRRKVEGVDFYNDCIAEANQLRTVIYNLLQSNKDVKNSHRKSGNRINTKRLYKVPLGDHRIFKSNSILQRVNTAVHLLVDMSGSMRNNDAYKVASKTALSLSIALNNINGINLGVTYFSKNNYGSPLLSVIKHGDSVDPFNAGMFIASKPMGGTPMAEAVMYGASELVNTKEDKKILMIVTDGYPDNLPSTENVIALCRDGDFIVIGIGIYTSSIADFCDQFVVIENVNQLSNAFIELLKNNIY